MSVSVAIDGKVALDLRNEALAQFAAVGHVLLRQPAPNPQQTQLFTDIHGDAPFRLLSVYIDAKFRNTKLKAVKKWFSETKPQSGIH